MVQKQNLLLTARSTERTVFHTARRPHPAAGRHVGDVEGQHLCGYRLLLLRCGALTALATVHCVKQKHPDCLSVSTYGAFLGQSLACLPCRGVLDGLGPVQDSGVGELLLLHLSVCKSGGGHCHKLSHMGSGEGDLVVQANVWTGQSSSTPLKVYNPASTDEMMLALWGILTFIFFVQTLVRTPSLLPPLLASQPLRRTQLLQLGEIPCARFAAAVADSVHCVRSASTAPCRPCSCRWPSSFSCWLAASATSSATRSALALPPSYSCSLAQTLLVQPAPQYGALIATGACACSIV